MKVKEVMSRNPKVCTLGDNLSAAAGLMWEKKRAAQEAAHRIDGVLDVANEIEVRPTGEFQRTESDISHGLT